MAIKKQVCALTVAAALLPALTACSEPAPDYDVSLETQELLELLDGHQVFVGASVWDGQADDYMSNAAIVVRHGRVVQIFSLDEQPLPDDMRGRDVEVIDLSGHYVVPGLVNAHGHVGMADGLQTGEDIYSEENVQDQLKLYAHYGVTSVVSLGDEPSHAFRVRDEMDVRQPGHSRLWLAGDVLNPQSPEEATEQVDDALAEEPDWLKIRVDDQLGQREAMSESVYRRVIERSHEHGLPLASHMVTLADAKGLLRAGTDLLAHSVRDAAVDDELIDLMTEAGICITPTLTREVSTYVYAERPDFFDDPFFTQAADESVLEALQQPDMQARFTGEAADYYRQALPLAKDNMMRMHEGGVRVAMGTDSGPPARFQGYFEHMEMEMMVDAGMSAEQVMRSATYDAAACMGVNDEVGSLQAGRWADFLVLDADPKADIENLRQIHAVYIAGERFQSPYPYTHRQP